ncbi:transcription antitermination factor NusB [Salisediminibacterium selenitireducens]|uniref:Transcription antitermination protein NusB n=1 Tax=Bacillus selenitireducens (strain ATCC 700615 / DSM 15326 / MLS10) TaxID=439292 RepID=D6XW20_BACIE|nr:transcription antitermination factor NusB [Salisediminibacterium selenitireducens]ADH99774.1 NusB antitermination factor [[Bacillus] selenitireducens MLS10]
MKRRVARIKAIQALYQVEMTGVNPEEAIKTVLEENESMDPYLLTLVERVLEEMDELDIKIQDSMDNWQLSRLARVDRAIMRIAMYEMIHSDDVPVSVAINEAIDLARGFSGDEESGKFVNGVLSNAAKKLEVND